MEIAKYALVNIHHIDYQGYNSRHFIWGFFSLKEVIQIETASMDNYPLNKAFWLITWWRHQMETFSALLALCAGNSPVTVEFPTQRTVARIFDIFFDLCLNERLSKQSGDLRRNRVLYDVTVMNLIDGGRGVSCN